MNSYCEWEYFHILRRWIRRVKAELLPLRSKKYCPCHYPATGHLLTPICFLSPERVREDEAHLSPSCAFGYLILQPLTSTCLSFLFLFLACFLSPKPPSSHSIRITDTLIELIACSLPTRPHNGGEITHRCSKEEKRRHTWLQNVGKISILLHGSNFRLMSRVQSIIYRPINFVCNWERRLLCIVGRNICYQPFTSSLQWINALVSPFSLSQEVAYGYAQSLIDVHWLLGSRSWSHSSAYIDISRHFVIVNKWHNIRS